MSKPAPVPLAGEAAGGATLLQRDGVMGSPKPGARGSSRRGSSKDSVRGDQLERGAIAGSTGGHAPRDGRFAAIDEPDFSRYPDSFEVDLHADVPLGTAVGRDHLVDGGHEVLAFDLSREGASVETSFAPVLP